MQTVTFNECGSGKRRSETSKAVVTTGGILGIALSLSLMSGAALANAIGENAPWQFNTTQDKVNKGIVLDLIEKKKGGFYDSYSTTINNTNTTYIDKQFNCSQTSGATGNLDSNSLQASASSPSTSTSGALNSSTSANSATNGLSQAGLQGILTAGLNTLPNGSVGTDQNNQGTLSSGIQGSSSSATTGTINANGGQTHAALNSTQSNAGYQSSQISGSTACNGLLAN